jgi:hypothetical protein
MISANDVLQVISEIHQYSLLFIELRTAATLGIMHTSSDAMSYFKFEGSLKHSERRALVNEIYGGQIPGTLKSLTVEEFLHEIEGKMAKHIWLETVGKEPTEHGFLSISELKTFFRRRSHH